jgi:hypothetical protein
MLELILGFRDEGSNFEMKLSRHHRLRAVGIGLLLIVAGGCRPQNQNMLVAYVTGDVFLPNLRPGNWNFGETKQCEIASRGSVPPDKGRDLLLCGDSTRLAGRRLG